MTIVKMAANHRAFCACSWLSSYWASGCHGMGHRGEAYYNRFIPLVDGLLDDGTTWVAVSPEDHDQILGWCCMAANPMEPALLYVYVKQLFRVRAAPDAPHVAEALLRSTGHWPVGREVLHVGRFRTPAWEAFARKHGIDCSYDGSEREVAT
jgi:hypothetical protein